MNTEEIKEFLRNKQGYLKEGGKRLRNILNKKGFNVTIKDCKVALRDINLEIRKPYLNPNNKAKILLYDIEVSYGLARVWNPGWKLNVKYDDMVKFPKIICISWKWNDSDEVHTVHWGDAQDDKFLLEVFIKELNKADAICAHNGDNFDLPWIRARALYHKLPMYPKYNTIDTLKIARYNHKFPSNRLDDLGDYLQIGRKIKTDRQLWVDTVCNGSQEALEKMIKYCEQDVFLLEDVYNELSKMTLPRVHAGVLNNKTKQTSPYTGSSNLKLVKTTSTKAGTKKHLMKCLDTDKYFELSDINYRKYKEINN